MEEIKCIFCEHIFEIKKWDVIPCPNCGAEYDYEDDEEGYNYIRWEYPDA